MANRFSDARKALVAALKADIEIGGDPLAVPVIPSRVKTWLDWGPGLRKRFLLEPAYCTVLSVYPASDVENRRYNAAKDINQDLLLRIVAYGQDVEPAEELLALVMARIDALRQTALGMSDEGLKDISTPEAVWDPYPDEKGANVIWDVAVTLRISWTVFT